MFCFFFFFFFFQAEDGIRDHCVTGVQTCALPIFDLDDLLVHEQFEFLIARGGYEKLELLVNKKIIEVEAGRRSISVTDVEVRAEIGKASGWGRGEILGGAGSFKKKKKKNRR